MLHRTSHVDGSNWSTPSLVHHSGAMRLAQFPKIYKNKKKKKIKKKKTKSHQNHQTTYIEIYKK